MHRSTPADTLHRAYSSGGARALIDKIDDNHLMQEFAGSFMKGEARKAIEAPQNYGFTSCVRAATRGKDGQIEECAEGFMSFLGGSRSFPICGLMDDRRYRPWSMKEGECAQYDDLGQMTLLRRTGLYLLSLDSADDSQSSSSGSTTPATRDSGGGGGQTVARMVSVRHVEKQKQPRPSGAQGAQGAAGSQQSGQQSGRDFKHEGETVNMEMRVTKSRIEFRSGDSVVGYYDKQSSKWVFIGEVHLGKEDASHRVYGVQGGVGRTTESSGSGAVLVNCTQPGPPTSDDMQPLSIEQQFAMTQQELAATQQRLAVIEERLARLGG